MEPSKNVNRELSPSPGTPLRLLEQSVVSILRWAKFLKHMPPLDALRLAYHLHPRPRTAKKHPIAIRMRGVGTLHIRAGTSDARVLQQTFIDRQYDVFSSAQFLALMEEYHETVRSGGRPLIIDCGANIGLSSVFFSQVFPEAEIVAVEPAADNVSIAQKNVAARLSIRVVEAAVHSSVTKLALNTSSAEEWAYTTGPAATEGAPAVLVRTVTIDSLCEETSHQKILVVKIDIEGAESELFSGDTSWMERTVLIIIELHDWLFPGKQTSVSFFKALEGRRFEILQRDENLFIFLKNHSRLEAASATPYFCETNSSAPGSIR
jgi:FkbM family methyltransferase